jgi:hypothetical protein
MANGGKRPGAGRKVGYRAPGTLDKLQARELLRQMVIARLQPLVEAQMANAEGLKYLVVRDKRTGKFERVTEAFARQQTEDEQDKETIEVWEKDPSVQAFSDLLNRALDKPTESVEVSGHDGKPLEIIIKKPW